MGRSNEVHDAELGTTPSLDELAGLHDRNYLLKALRKELVRSKRERHELSLVLIDVDHLGEISDRYGPQGEKSVLHRVATAAADTKTSDHAVLARYSVEEFAMLLPGLDEVMASQLAEELRKTVDRTELNFQGEGLHVTVSLGVATLRDDADDDAHLVERATRALDQAKRQGRNQVCITGA